MTTKTKKPPVPTTWVPGWAQKITAAQRVKTIDVAGTTYQRKAYGPADVGSTNANDVLPRCRDCGAAIGELHVPDCCVERCPRCKRDQAVGCQCYRQH